MKTPEINPEKITHPFQLMAAWFVMLILLAGSLLAAAAKIEKPGWAPGFLAISAVALSVLVMGVVFLMLTRFQPHLQGPKEYAAWLKDERRFSVRTLQTIEVGQGLSARVAASLREYKEVLDVPGLESESDSLPPFETRRQSTGEDGEDSESRNRQDKVASALAYPVQISNLRKAREVVTELRRLGFYADIYRPEIPHSDCESGVLKASGHAAIWIGSRVPPQVAVVAIKRVATIWKHLRFLHLSGDGGAPPDEIHDQLFFGGSTATAIDYGLGRWTPREIGAVSEDVSLEDFHRLVRSKYRHGGTASLSADTSVF